MVQRKKPFCRACEAEKNGLRTMLPINHTCGKGEPAILDERHWPKEDKDLKDQPGFKGPPANHDTLKRKKY